MTAIMKELDTDGSGKVDYTEFIGATMNKKVALTHDYVWQVFKQFDTDHTGTISKDDLATILSSGKMTKFSQVVGLQKNEIEEIMAEYDLDGSGDIDFDEFVAFMLDAKGLSQKEINLED